jgi:hypothetical protein
MRLRNLTLCVAALALAGCGDSSGPTVSPAAKSAIARFEFLADSLTNAGNPDDAQIFTGAAEAVRVTGDVGTIPVSIDGTASDFSALTLHLQLPGGTVCDDVSCETTPPVQEQFLIAWQEDPVGRILFIAKDGFGTRSVAYDTTATDTLTAPPPGVALVGDEAGDGWYSIAGSATNQGLTVSGACAKPKEETPGIRYDCRHATYRWSADFTAAETAGDAIGTEHHVVIPSSVVAGAAIAITGFTDELAASIGRAPIRSRLVLKRDRALAPR